MLEREVREANERVSETIKERDEMEKCNATESMNDYISQKALVYTLIQAYKA